MTKLAVAVASFAVAAAAVAAFSGDSSLYLLAAAALLCAATTWRGAAMSSYLRLFVVIFSVETIVFGLCVIAIHLGRWPAALGELTIPDSLPLTVAMFSILVYAISQLPGLKPMIAISDLYFASADAGEARIWPFGTWRTRERSIAVAMVVFLVLVNQAQVAMSVRISFFSRDWFNAIQEKNAPAFWAQLFFVFAPLAFTYVASQVIEFVVQSMLVIRWRRWLTRYYVGHWLDDHAHYRMSLAGGGADNPDQRIAEDVNRFIAGGETGYGIYSYSILLISTLSSLVSFAIILWGLSGNYVIPGTSIAIPGFLFWVAFLYTAFGTAVTHLIGRSLVPLSFQRQRVEADFRFSLARLREFSEQVALLSGERAEKASLTERFGAIIGNYLRIVDLKKRLTAFTASYQQVSPFIPYVFAAPFYFADKITLGVMTQTARAFSQVESALNFFVNYYTSLADFRSVVDRLSSFDASIFRAREAGREGPRRVDGAAGAVALKHVDVALPDGRVIMRGADLVLPQGQSALLTGPSGSGKSTLLRAIAGLWPHGGGAIEAPAGASMMVVPQKPYIPHGTLRAAVSYPDPPGRHSDEEIAAALRLAKLDALAGRLDADDMWSQRLSGGEQQRLALARALLARPDWLFLDEATAAMDESLEADLYRMLAAQLPGTTIVSIGHRSTLDALHQRKIAMRPADDGSFSPQEARVAAE